MSIKFKWITRNNIIAIEKAENNKGASYCIAEDMISNCTNKYQFETIEKYVNQFGIIYGYSGLYSMLLAELNSLRTLISVE